jgi:hypothetical protein
MMIENRHDRDGNDDPEKNAARGAQETRRQNMFGMSVIHSDIAL